MPDVLAYGIAGFAAWLLGISAWHKLRFSSFFTELASTYLGGASVPSLLIRFLATVELVVAIALLIPSLRVLALGAAAGILLAYALLILSRILAGQRDMRCGCAGPASQLTLSPLLVVRNLLCGVLLLAAVPVLVTPLGPLLTFALAVSVSTFLVVLYLCCENLIANAQQMSKGV